MKNPNQINRDRKPAKPAAQPKAAGNDRLRVKVPLSADEKEEVLAAAKRRGLTPDELFEKAIRRQLTPSAEPKPETVRLTVRFSEAQHAVITRGAKRSGLTVSKYVERAIHVMVSLFDAASRAGREGRCEMTAASKHREAVIPKDWKEVAFIDFSGYVDRDCEERIIYKTPGGELKASRYSNDKPTVMVIEDVTREQVARWLLECVIPEEFESEFRRALPNIATKGGCKMNRLTPAITSLGLLEDELSKTSELFDALVVADPGAHRRRRWSSKSASLLDGLAKRLAMRFDDVIEAVREAKVGAK